jgi:hypothetical protein
MLEQQFEKELMKRLATYSDYIDLISSFLFNLLSNALAIRNTANNVNTYSNNGKYAELFGEYAKLLRIVIDFESANAASLTLGGDIVLQK